MNRRSMVIAIVTIICEVIPQPMFAQCAHSEPPIQPLLKQLQADTKAIFVKFESVFPVFASQAPVKKEEIPAADWLIVPGGRAGGFEIGSTFKAIGTKILLSPVKQRADPRYALILPLGYIPERQFAESKEEQFTFAATEKNGSVTEIFVRNSKYHTENEIRVGSSVSELRRVGTLTKKNSKQGAEYYQGDGITFIATGGVIREIVVIRRREANP